MSPRAASLADFWSSLPAGLRAPLLVGAVGRNQLVSLAGAAAAQGSPLAGEFLLAAWQSSPLEGELARRLLAARVRLEPRLAAAVAAVAASSRQPERLDYYQRLAERRDHERLRRYLDGEAAKEPGNLYWLAQGLFLDAALGDWPAAARRWEAAAVGLAAGLAPLASAGMAEAAFFSGRLEDARRLWAEALANLPLAEWRMRLAEALLRLGRAEAAMPLFEGVLAERPWHANLLLKAHDLRAGLPARRAALPGSLAILLYSWNKAADLDATLAGLAASNPEDLGDGARIVLLDNGSTDATRQVVASWAERLGQRLHAVRLPVNIGAPAARNWLLTTPAARAADWLCYLDDDVDLPPDWLGVLGAAVEAHPGAAVWGCQVLDHAQPSQIQSADYHLCYAGQPPEELDFGAARPNPFGTSSLHLQDLDYGRFSYLRPCVSVTGCCHLFRAQTLRASGGFKIHLSPSQFDDLEHDLRLAAAGGYAAYQGHLRIRHRKASGRAALVSRAQHGNALGNRHKLEAMHPPTEIAAIMAADAARLEADLQAKARRLDGR